MDTVDKPEKITQIGLVTIRYRNEDRKTPHLGLMRREIIFPDTPELEFTAIESRGHFLISLPGLVRKDRKEVWFGGNDGDYTFLERIEAYHHDLFQNHGPAVFYESLKPTPIKILEARLRVEATRRGMVFSIPLPFSWKQIEEYLTLMLIFVPAIVPGNHYVDSERFVINHVGHRPFQNNLFLYDGRRTSEIGVKSCDNSRTRYCTLCVVEGRITTPDNTLLFECATPHLVGVFRTPII